jgi:hypothetical protein
MSCGHTGKFQVTVPGKKRYLKKKGGGGKLLTQLYKYLKFRINFKALNHFSLSVVAASNPINFSQQEHSRLLLLTYKLLHGVGLSAVHGR